MPETRLYETFDEGRVRHSVAPESREMPEEHVDRYADEIITENLFEK